MIYNCYACGQDVDTSKPLPATFVVGLTPEQRMKEALKKLVEAEPCASCTSEGCHGHGSCPCGGICHDNIERARTEAKSVLNFG